MWCSSPDGRRGRNCEGNSKFEMRNAPRICGTRSRVEFGNWKKMLTSPQLRDALTRAKVATDAKVRSGWCKGAIGMDVEDPCLLTQRPLRSERGDWLFGMGYWFVALLRPACAGLGPLRPTPAHSQMSLRDGMDVRLRGGIQRAPATGGWEWGSRIRGTRSRVHFLWLVLKKKK